MKARETFLCPTLTSVLLPTDAVVTEIIRAGPNDKTVVRYLSDRDMFPTVGTPLKRVSLDDFRGTTKAAQR